MKERFINKVHKTDYCWIWNGAIRGNSGYGSFNVNGKIESSHRISYKLFKGVIPMGICVLHRCDNRLCVNPDHLFLGTQGDNMKDMFNKGRMNPLSIMNVIKCAKKRRKSTDNLVWCYECKHMLPKKSFHKNKSRYNGLMNKCKECRKVTK